jgi:hypothetical protein
MAMMSSSLDLEMQLKTSLLLRARQSPFTSLPGMGWITGSYGYSVLQPGPGDAAEDFTAAEGQAVHPSPPFQVWEG